MIGQRALFLAALGVIGAASARAAMTGTHNKPKIRPLGAGLAAEFKVPREEVTRLHDRGLTWVEVRRVLAQKTAGKPVGKIRKMPNQKEGRRNRRPR